MPWSQAASSSSSAREPLLNDTDDNDNDNNHDHYPIGAQNMDSKLQPELVEDVARGTEHRKAHGARDRAAELLDSVGGEYVLTAAESKRILRKIDLHILPILLFVYFLQQLDKSTLSYASVFGLLDDTNLKGEDYSWLGSVVYIAQLVAQPLLAYLLVRLPIGKFAFTMVLCWGIVLTCMSAAHNFAGLMVSRLLLGAFEASIAPTFLAITSMWWRRSEQTNRVASWYAMNGVTNMVGSLLTYGLGNIPSSLKTYQIIFLFCGAITVAFAPVMYFYLPDSPMEAKFLNHEDRLIAIERLRMNQMGVMSKEWKWSHVKESCLDIKTWAWFSLIFSISIPSGGITTFGPLIVKSFGFSKFTTILFNIPFGAVQIVATLGGAYLATRFQRKGPVIALLCLPPIAGCAMLMEIDHTTGSKAALLVGYYLISFYPGISPLIYSWSAQNTAGDTKRKVTTAFLFIGQSAGNIIGPHLYTTEEAPAYFRGLVSNLCLYIAIIVIVVITTIYLHFLNRSHAKRRVAAGKSAIVIDESMSAVKDTPTVQQVEDDTVKPVPTEETVLPDVQKHKIGDKAFEDETDLRNEDFIFVY